MRTLYAGLGMLSLAALVGCGGATGTSEKHPGGPGAATNPTARAPVVGEGKGTFDLSPPLTATHLKQGEAKEAKIGIKRGENFDKDVTLKFSDVPKGVTIDPASPTIKHGDKEATVTIKAADDAAVGDFKIKIAGHAAEGKEAANVLEVKVDKK
jgi:uncharacterized membrane protein